MGMIVTFTGESVDANTSKCLCLHPQSSTLSSFDTNQDLGWDILFLGIISATSETTNTFNLQIRLFLTCHCCLRIV
ncbi:hypothetical protein MPTK1_1g02410 [Marchantia polymorpha subsp. ruderalis]|uniref:Uncharacterized protein n=2 Tax=Marchantia polymorpha TaxID=3197 RepID=A0AAF6AKQ2_MARPO|nr:hypothetical protein MARPO_0029s0006 [Marchantia polymorpha]BBM97022.1 hypothetical protein Mp_1g02410 [Marchantia polymorpha subsp. ruderalis]|eukprot:PTQ42459.1 hypothetical protein MARPO_0029s0006 [Marchantia polymorpha]